MRTLCLSVLFLVSTGCTQYVWQRTDGRTDQAAIEQFRKDRYECERDMRQSGYYGAGAYGAVEAKGFGERCMQARGYNKVPADEASKIVH